MRAGLNQCCQTASGPGQPVKCLSIRQFTDKLTFQSKKKLLALLLDLGEEHKKGLWQLPKSVEYKTKVKLAEIIF